MATFKVNFQSYEQFLENSILSFQSRLGLTDTSINSALLSLLETSAQADFYILSQQIAVLDASDLNRLPMVPGRITQGIAEEVSAVQAELYQRTS